MNFYESSIRLFVSFIQLPTIHFFLEVRQLQIYRLNIINKLFCRTEISFFFRFGLLRAMEYDC